MMTQSAASTARTFEVFNELEDTRCQSPDPAHDIAALHFVLLSVLISASVAAQAQTNLRVRGTITAFDGSVLSVKTREGKDLRLNLGEKTVVVRVERPSSSKT